jgi:hypothetical protein
MLASEHDMWTSHAVKVSEAPTRWGDIQCGYIRLRDDGVDAWPHALVTPNTFWFFLPRIPCPDRPWEHALIRHIKKQCSESTLEVHLFAVRSHVEFYGVWTATCHKDIDNVRSLLTLHRHSEQPTGMIYPQKQAPLHIRVHEHYIRRNVPHGWSLCHEERNGPSVINGKRFHVNTFTCDLILARGCQRICIVSVPTEVHISSHQLSRCTYLRDRMLCRVVLVVGTPPDVQWLDFGYRDEGCDPIRYCSMNWLHECNQHLSYVVERLERP